MQAVAKSISSGSFTTLRSGVTMRLADHGAHVIFSTRTVTTSAVAQSREPWRTLQSTIVLRERCPTMRARSSSGWAIDAGLKKLTQRLPVTTTKGGGPPARSWPAVRQWDDSAAQTAWQSTIERFALDHADCVDGLCLSGSLAKGAAAPDYPWALPSAAYDAWLRMLVAGWGGPVDLETFAPSAKEDPVLRAWWARIVRHGASPGGMRTILSGLRDADIRKEMNRIAAPTLVMHRRGDSAVRFDAGAHVAQNIPGAVWKPFDGTDHFWWCGNSAQVVEAVLAFAGRESACRESSA